MLESIVWIILLHQRAVDGECGVKKSLCQLDHSVGKTFLVIPTILWYIALRIAVEPPRAIYFSTITTHTLPSVDSGSFTETITLDTHPGKVQGYHFYFLVNNRQSNIFCAAVTPFETENIHTHKYFMMLKEVVYCFKGVPSISTCVWGSTAWGFPVE